MAGWQDERERRSTDWNDLAAFKWPRDGVDKVPACLLIVGEKEETEQVAAAVMKQRED